MSAALGLFRLQQVDRQMDQTLARLNAIQQTLDNDNELRAVLDQVEAAKAEDAPAENPCTKRKPPSRPSRSRSNRPKAACTADGSTTPRNCRTSRMTSLH